MLRSHLTEGNNVNHIQKYSVEKLLPSGGFRPLAQPSCKQKIDRTLQGTWEGYLWLMKRGRPKTDAEEGTRGSASNRTVADRRPATGPRRVTPGNQYFPFGPCLVRASYTRNASGQHSG